MNAARRGHKRLTWPRGLREPRPGYYAYETPDGRIIGIGRVSLARAKAEALAANLHYEQQRPTLVDRLTGAHHTVSDLLDMMPASSVPNTAKSLRSIDGMIRRALGDIGVTRLTTKHCAELIESQIAERKVRQALSIRSRLIAVCNRGRQLGWMTTNPAEPTARPKPTVKRGRLTLESFLAIYEQAPRVSGWLQIAMQLALVTGADRSTIASLTRSDIRDDCLYVKRSKTEKSTGMVVAIPLALTLDCVGWSLRNVLAHRTGVLSRYIVHHTDNHGNAPAGSPVFVDRISKAFAEARDLAGITGDDPPTFHEIRSLAKRLYTEQGNVDTKALLGHSDEKTAAIYADPRGVEPVKVRIS